MKKSLDHLKCMHNSKNDHTVHLSSIYCTRVKKHSCNKSASTQVVSITSLFCDNSRSRVRMHCSFQVAGTSLEEAVNYL